MITFGASPPFVDNPMCQCDDEMPGMMGMEEPDDEVQVLDFRSAMTRSSTWFYNPPQAK